MDFVELADGAPGQCARVARPTPGVIRTIHGDTFPMEGRHECLPRPDAANKTQPR